MKNKHVFLCILSLSFCFFQANCMEQKNSEDWVGEVLLNMSRVAELPTQDAAKMFLAWSYQDFRSSKECTAMLKNIYETPSINNGDVGSAVSTAAMAYAQKMNQPLKEGETFAGEEMYGIIERFFVKQAKDQKVTLPDKGVFLSELNAIESNFCGHFGRPLEEHLYDDSMTKKRAQLLVDAAIFKYIKNLAAANLSMASAYKLMEYPKKIKAFILVDA